MSDWAELLGGGVAMAMLAVGWLGWQRLAGRLDAAMRNREPPAKCSLPDDMDAYERRQCGACGGTPSRDPGEAETRGPAPGGHRR